MRDAPSCDLYQKSFQFNGQRIALFRSRLNASPDYIFLVLTRTQLLTQVVSGVGNRTSRRPFYRRLPLASGVHNMVSVASPTFLRVLNVRNMLSMS